MGKYFISIVLCAFTVGSIYADTFIHKTSKNTYDGYSSRPDELGQATLYSANEQIPIKLADYTILQNAKGRNPFITVIPIDDAISTEIATAAFEKTIAEEADKGPLFVLIELDTPGGRVDFTQRICSAIMDTRNCLTVAYITGGQEGGAYSAGAAVSLACDKIYMAPNASVGAATLVTSIDGRTVDIEKVVGENMGEKSRSIWRTYLAAMAQQNGRPAVLARAMEDKNISIIEIRREGQTMLIDDQDRLASDKFIRTRCKAGELLTLTTQDALQCGIADGIAQNRADLMHQMAAEKAKVSEIESLRLAAQELAEVQEKLETLAERLDLHFKELSAKAHRGSLRRSDALNNYKKIIREVQYVQKLANDYPDVEIDEESLVDLLNHIKADYESIRSMR